MNTTIETSIKNYISRISEKFELDISELEEMWKENLTLKKEKNVKKSIVEENDVEETNNESTEESNEEQNEMTEKEYEKLKKTDLQELCKKRKLKSSGTKAQLIEILMSNTEPAKKVESKKTSKVVTKVDEKVETKSKSKTTKKEVAELPILSKISRPKTVVVRLNKFQNYEDLDTGLVFNKEQYVIGKQNSDGTVDELTPEDIETCRQYTFKYQIPKNLNKNIVAEENIEELINEDEDLIEEGENVEDLEELIDEGEDLEEEEVEDDVEEGDVEDFD
jgi:hypothetical protein